MHVLVAKPAQGYRLPLLPLVHRGHAALLGLPVAVDQEGAVAVGLLPHPHLLREGLVVLALRVLGVVDARHAVRVPPLYQPRHPLLLVAGHQRRGVLLVAQRDGVGRLELDRVALVLEGVLGRAAQLDFPAADGPLVPSFLLAAAEEAGERGLLLLLGRDVGDQREDGRVPDLGLVPVVLGGPEEVVALRGVAALVRRVGESRDVRLIALPVGVARPVHEVGHVQRVPGAAVEGSRHIGGEEG